jgi:hypothetical protein
MKNDNLKHFEILNNIDVSDKIEKKKTGSVGLNYLSWAFAWGELKKEYPNAIYEIQKFNGLPYVYDPFTGYMVYTKITVENITHEMWLPVMDGANKAMKDKQYTYLVQKKEWNKQYNKYVQVKDKDGNMLYDEKIVEQATMFDINKTIMRCLVKNIAMFGLGLYIYTGEDLPEDVENNKKSNIQTKPTISFQDFKTKIENSQTFKELESYSSKNYNVKLSDKKEEKETQIDLLKEARDIVEKELKEKQMENENNLIKE